MDIRPTRHLRSCYYPAPRASVTVQEITGAREMSRTVHTSVVMTNLLGLRDYLIRHNRMDVLPDVLAVLELATPDANGRISMDANTRNIHRIAEIIGDPCLGLDLVAHLPDDTLSLIRSIDAQFGPANRRLRQHPLMVMRLLERYLHVFSQVVDIHCQVTRNEYRIRLAPYASDVSHHQVDGALVVVHRVFRLLVQEKLLSVALAHEGTSASADRYRAHLGVTPSFCQPQVALVYSNSNHHHAEVSDYLGIVTLNEHALNAQFPELSFGERCRGVIRLLLALGEPRREHLCQVFSTSLPTLKRRLQAEGTSYAALVKAVRQELALQYLHDNTLSVTETALLLGYQDIHQYSRAFKGWFGCAPSEYAARN